jgi:GNAT superfamily N-acetyltransferase
VREGKPAASFDSRLAGVVGESRGGRRTKIDAEYSAVKRLKDGTRVRLRLLRSSDREALLEGFQRLSPESRYRRFLSPTPKLSEEMLRRLTDTDDWNHLAIVAERASKRSSPAEGLGIARFIRLEDAPDTAEAAVVVVDAVQRLGLGRLLLLALVEAARERGIKQFRTYVLPDNEPAQRLLHELDEHAEARVEDRLRVFELPLPGPSAGTERADPVYRFLRFAAQGVTMIFRALRA